MESNSNAGAVLPALHDEFMQDLHETGLYNYAQGIDLIQDGQLSEPRINEDLRMWHGHENYGAQAPQGPSDEDFREGEMRIAAASAAAERAVSAAEQVKQRLRAAQDAEYGEDGGHTTPSKPRKARKGPGRGDNIGGRSSSKGLRHFSMKVCEKVEGKGRTTYNEVADELVNDLPGPNDPGSPGGLQYDEKNIRRRVYDALNVLMAMGIISREKKEIFWEGLPQGQQLSLDRLRAERHRRCQTLDQQRKYIAELVQQQATYRSLIQRNQQRTMESLMQTGNHPLAALPLPFVLIQVDRNATVEIKISEDNRVAHFDFEGMPFKFTGDEQVLQEMGVHNDQDELTVRALAAAADVASPRPTAARQTPTHPPGGSNPSSRAHPPQLPASAAPLGDGGLGLLGNAASVASGPLPSQPALDMSGPGRGGAAANGAPGVLPSELQFAQQAPGMSPGMHASPQMVAPPHGAPPFATIPGWPGMNPGNPHPQSPAGIPQSQGQAFPGQPWSQGY